ncbi:MAG TPA: Imm17 family immunity protein [Pirellulaceae bacterium]|nr:Imm17 family immunity protein [Pirellulaceae bacterium]
MPIQDIFVGVVTMVLGLALMAGAVLDGAWLMQLARPRFLATAFGKTAARLTLALIGAGLIALGTAVALGWRVDWS